MAVSKVTLVNNNVSQTLIDVSNDTAVAADVAQGKTFHLATGEQAVGTASGQSLPTQTKTVAPSTMEQSVTPDSGYSLAEVVVEAVTSSIDSNIIPSNIRQGVNILGVTGTMQEGSGSNATLLSVVNRSITTINASDFAGLTTVGTWAFAGCSQLTGGTLPSTVTYIGFGAFQECNSLTETMITDNITSVQDNAYAYCGSLSNFTWTANCNRIPPACFSNSGLTSVTIPSPVTSLGSNCFINCANLTEFTIPSSVTFIEHGIVEGCGNLSVVTILATTPPSCSSSNPLTNDYSALDYVRVPDEAVTTYQNTWPWSQYNIIGVSTPILPYTSATQFRFDVDGHITRYLGNKTKVITPTSYNKISTSTTFNGVNCYLENFGSQASSFAGLTVTISADGDINNATDFDETTIGNAASQFGSYAYIMKVDATNSDYSNMWNLSWLLTPQFYPQYVNGTIVYDSQQWYDIFTGASTAQLFYGTGNVITFEDGDNIAVTQIDNNAFVDSSGMPSSITQLEISEGVTYIGANFTQDANIQRVKFPSTLRDLGYAAFTGCSSLYTVEIAQGNTNIIMDNNIVYKVDSTTGLRTLLFALCGYGGNISLYNTVTEIRDYAFSGSAYSSIQINNVGSITSLTLGSGLFANSQIQFINFTNMSDTISINSDTFNNASYLQTLTLPPCDGGGSLNLSSLPSLYSVDISQSGITNLTLTGLANLGTITIPASVTSISGQITNCPNLTVITVDATTPPSVQADCFDYSNVNTVYVPQGTLSAYQSATGWSTRNIIEQGSTPTGSYYATIYYDDMGQEMSEQINITALNYQLDFTNRTDVYRVDIQMSVTEFREAGGTLIGAENYIIARQYNSGTISYINFVSGGYVTITSPRIPATSGESRTGLVTMGLSGAGVTSTSGMATIINEGSNYSVTIVPRNGATDFEQIDMTLSDDLKVVSYFNVIFPSTTVPLPYEVNGNTITGTAESLSGDIVLPTSYSLEGSEVIEGSDYELSQINLVDDHANDLVGATSLTIPANYTVAYIGGNLSNLNILILEGRLLQSFYIVSSSITTIRCMSTVPPTIDSNVAAYLDTISTLTTIEVPYEAYAAYQASNWGQTNKRIEAIEYPYTSAEYFDISSGTINGYYGSDTEVITPITYNTMSDTREGAYVGIGDFTTFWNNMQGDNADARITLRVVSESNNRTLTISTDSIDFNEDVEIKTIEFLTVTAGSVEGSGYAIDMLSSSAPLMLNGSMLWTSDMIMGWYDGNAGVSTYTLGGNITVAIDGFTNSITTIGDMTNYSTQITSLIVSEGITTINDYALLDQSMLQTLELPSTISAIGDYAFSGCTNLTTVIIKAVNPPMLGTDSFGSATTTIQVPASAVSDYQNDSSYSNFTIEAIPNT